MRFKNFLNEHRLEILLEGRADDLVKSTYAYCIRMLHKIHDFMEDDELYKRYQHTFISETNKQLDKMSNEWDLFMRDYTPQMPNGIKYAGALTVRGAMLTAMDDLVKRYKYSNMRGKGKDLSSAMPDFESKIKVRSSVNELRMHLREFIHFGSMNNDFVKNYSPEEELGRLENVVGVTIRASDMLADIASNIGAAKKAGGIEGSKESSDVVLDLGKYFWVKIPNACRDEAEAMGHCATGSTSRNGSKPAYALSLREMSKAKSKKKTHQIPRITAIMHEDGTLSEIKGFANGKPAREYHPAIIELLEQPFVKGMVGGGYAAFTNFAITDLTDQQIENLRQMKGNDFVEDAKMASKMDKGDALEPGTPLDRNDPDQARLLGLT